MLYGFAHPTNADFLNNLELPLDQPEDLGELDGRIKLQLFNAFIQTLNRNYTLNHTTERDFNTIFNHEIEVIDRADRKIGAVRFSTAQPFAMQTLTKSCMGWLWFFYDIYLQREGNGAGFLLHRIWCGLISIVSSQWFP